MEYEIYCDGSTRNNGYGDATGGWAYVILTENVMIYAGSGKAGADATNQRMELTAAREACKKISTVLTDQDYVTIYSDSAYLINCIKQNWYINWESNGWINSKKHAVANQDLWKSLIPYFKNIKYKWKKCAGHAGDFWNELVDAMAQHESLEARR